MAEKDLTSGSGLPPEYTIAVIAATTLPLVSPPTRGLNTACSSSVGAAGEGNRLPRSQPPKAVACWKVGFCMEKGSEAGFGLGWKPFPEQVLRAPAHLRLHRSLPGRPRPGAPGRRRPAPRSQPGKLLRFNLAYRAFLENRTLFPFLGVSGDRSLCDLCGQAVAARQLAVHGLETGPASSVITYLRWAGA